MIVHLNLSGGGCMRRNILLLLTILLSSCTVANLKDTAQIEGNHGVMLVKFIPNNYGYFISTVNKEWYIAGSAFFRIKSSDNLRVISLPEGEYIWKAFYSTKGHAEFKKEFGFKIEANQINYIGDLLIDIDFSKAKFKLAFKNNPETIDEFRELYPVLSKNLPITENITSISN